MAERDPAWSPDGKRIAWFSDESGEYALHIRDQNGMGEVNKIKLGEPPSYYYSPGMVAGQQEDRLHDKRLNVLVHGSWRTSQRRSRWIPTLTMRPSSELDPVWSPDSKWLAYTQELRKSSARGLSCIRWKAGKATQVTDGMSDALYAAFDKNGKYLYFTASTNVGLATGVAGYVERSASPVPAAYIWWCFARTMPSPLAPESDEEKAADKDKSADKDAGKDKERRDKDKDKAEARSR